MILENYFKNENEPKYKDDLQNEDKPKYENYPKEEDDLKMKTTAKMKKKS